MKNMTLIILASLFSLSAFADVLAVECEPPKMLTGGARIELADLVSAGKNSAGYEVYKGSLKITIGGSTAQPVFEGTVKVKGVALVDGALQLLSSNPQISTIYMSDSFENKKAISYIEMADGQRFNTQCRYL